MYSANEKRYDKMTYNKCGESGLFLPKISLGLWQNFGDSADYDEMKDIVLTGYIHGGCSPIGMKKFFKTTIHSTAENYDTIMFSAGKIGYQVETSLNSLKKVIRFDLEDIAD